MKTTENQLTLVFESAAVMNHPENDCALNHGYWDEAWRTDTLRTRTCGQLLWNLHEEPVSISATFNVIEVGPHIHRSISCG